MKVVVDDDRCGGHGACCTACPEVFTLNDEGFTIVLLPDVPPHLEDAVQEAARCCPERAITVS